MNLDLGTLINSLWIFLFLLLFLVPQMQRSSLNYSRRRVLTSLARRRKSTVITLIHRQETISFLGIPISKYIDIDDSEEVLRAIRLAPKDTPIDLILHTPGGIALAATQIAFALKAHKGKKTVMVPHYAMSGGTLIALAVDEIIMDPQAVLGPVDPQLGDQTGSYPATSLINVLKQKKIDKIDDKTLVMADQAKKAISQMKDTVKHLLKGRYSDDRVDHIVEELVSGKYTHDFPITVEETCSLFGECVKTDLPEEVYALMSLYRMETRPKRPSVEYVPVAPTGKGY